METGPTGTQVCVCVSAKPFNDNRKRPALKRYNILRRLEIEPRYSQRSLELFLRLSGLFFFFSSRPGDKNVPNTVVSRKAHKVPHFFFFVTATAAVVKKKTKRPSIGRWGNIKSSSCSLQSILSFVIDAAAVIVFGRRRKSIPCFGFLGHFQLHATPNSPMDHSATTSNQLNWSSSGENSKLIQRIIGDIVR